MTRLSKEELTNLKADIREALRYWFRALPRHTVESKCVSVSGTEYTPAELINAVENNTEFGQEFVTGLCLAERRMRKKNPKASVVELIGRSIVLERTASL
jgi:hypothetical protein